jgi:hypothetical protein
MGPFGTKCIAARMVLFDDLIGGGEQRWRHVEAEHFGSLEVNH